MPACVTQHIGTPLGPATDYATLGRKDKGNKSFVNPSRPDLQSAHVIRAVANVKFKRVITSHSGCHVVALTLDDEAYVWGRNEHHQLSYPLPESLTEPHNASNEKPSSTPMAPEPIRLKALPDSNVPADLKVQKIVHAACGRGHTILVTDQGEAWSAGWNVSGQCGRPEQEHISSFQRIKGGDLRRCERFIQASAGVSHSLLLSESGKVYAVGTAEKGVLGNGRTGEHIAGSRVLFQTEYEPILVKGAIEGKKIVQITSGQQHNVVLDSEGYCYAWGFGGLGRLGLGVQADSLIPAQIPYFANSNPLLRCKKIAAGSTNTLFIDNQDMVLLCGKFKVSGDGSAGQPWMTPRYVPDIMGYKWSLISGGGVTIFCHAKDPKEGDFTVCWGQTATYGELALGEGAPKSATKPQRIEYLDGIEMLDLAAGQNSTFFIARPPPTQAAKEEAKSIVEGTAETPASAPKAEAPAEPAPTAAPVVKPSYDISGFGFNFGPPAATSSAATPEANTPKADQADDDDAAAAAAQISRTTNAAWEELQRWPPLFEDEACKVCGGAESGGDKGEILECEKCEGAYHAGCLSPPIDGVPDGEWFCPTCDVPHAGGIPTYGEDEEDGEEEEEPVKPASKKRKAPAGGAGRGKKRR
ncbi:hypothetical protein JCM10908_001754 [Rhodotorula pacifica]|uniref:uncharacterized protein n=1 Tax=Rhodotorula pacifica TaxID=1495444 RepID=UPI003181DACF